MSFSFFIVYLSVSLVLLIWGFLNEEKLIDFEDRLIKRIRRYFSDRVRRKKLSVVKPEGGGGRNGGPFEGYVA